MSENHCPKRSFNNPFENACPNFISDAIMKHLAKKCLRGEEGYSAWNSRLESIIVGMSRQEREASDHTTFTVKSREK